MAGFVVNLTDYVPPARYDGNHWTQAQVTHSPDNQQAYSVIGTFPLSPLDADPQRPSTRNFTVSAPTASGWLVITFLDATNGQAPTDPVQYPPSTGRGGASPTLLSARYGVRHRIRDGVPALDPDPVPFNLVRLEDLSDQIPVAATPTQTVFQVRFDDVPTQRYMNAQVVPGTLVAYLDGAWTPTSPTSDVNINGNFTLPLPPLSSLKATYAWQYLSDGEIDQFVDEARQWLREYQNVTALPDGLVPALTSFAAYRALTSLASTAARLTLVRGGDAETDWSKLTAAWRNQAQDQYKAACCEREAYYSQGPEGLDPTVVDVSSMPIENYTPLS